MAQIWQIFFNDRSGERAEKNIFVIRIQCIGFDFIPQALIYMVSTVM